MPVSKSVELALFVGFVGLPGAADFFPEETPLVELSETFSELWPRTGRTWGRKKDMF